MNMKMSIICLLWITRNCVPAPASSYLDHAHSLLPAHMKDSGHIILSEIWHQQRRGYLLKCALTGINDSFSVWKKPVSDVSFCQRAGLSLSFTWFLFENVGDIRAPFLTLPRNLFAVIHARSAWKKNTTSTDFKIRLSWIIHQSKAPTLV